MDSTKRFSSRANQYAAHRPGYPKACIEFIRNQFNIDSGSSIADIGSGTGILTELLLGLDATVIGVEPNDDMRSIAEQHLNHNNRFLSISGTGESTNLADNSVDLITVAQAFHWLDPVKSKKEFKRILKIPNNIAILWNIQTRDNDFDRKYEEIKEKYGEDYITIRKSHEPDLHTFFSPGKYKVVKFPHFVLMDYDGLIGRIASSSFMPTAGNPHYAAMTEEVNTLFNNHQENRLVRFNYETHLHYAI